MYVMKKELYNAMRCVGSAIFKQFELGEQSKPLNPS